MVDTPLNQTKPRNECSDAIIAETWYKPINNKNYRHNKSLT